jgi:type I restriction enzyme S subunit
MDLYKLYVNDLLVSNINFHQGAIAINNFKENLLCSTHYQPYKVNYKKIIADYLILLLRDKLFLEKVNNLKTNGIKTEANYNFIRNIQIPLPDLSTQQKIVARYNNKILQAEQKEKQIIELQTSIEVYLKSELGIVEQKQEKNLSDKLLNFIEFKNLGKWDINIKKNILLSNKFKMKSIDNILSVNPKTNLPKEDMEISFLPMEDVSSTNDPTIITETRLISQSKGYTKFKNNDLVWAKITPCMQNGKSAVVKNLKNDYGCGSTEFHIIRNDNSLNEINIDYIHYLLKMKNVLQNAISHFSGSVGQQRVPDSYLKNLQIPLPPLQTQFQIVSRINKIKSQSSTVETEIKKLRKNAIYRI